MRVNNKKFLILIQAYRCARGEHLNKITFHIFTYTYIFTKFQKKCIRLILKNLVVK